MAALATPQPVASSSRFLLQILIPIRGRPRFAERLSGGRTSGAATERGEPSQSHKHWQAHRTAIEVVQNQILRNSQERRKTVDNSMSGLGAWFFPL
jgi:hypothetical protein